MGILELQLEALFTILAGPRTAPMAPRASLPRVYGWLTTPAGRRRIKCLLDSRCFLSRCFLGVAS